MVDARELIRFLDEDDGLGTGGALEALVTFYCENDLAAEAMATLCDWMDEEQITEALASWMQERGSDVPDDDGDEGE